MDCSNIFYKLVSKNWLRVFKDQFLKVDNQF
jgi:hypothetical protein